MLLDGKKVSCYDWELAVVFIQDLGLFYRFPMLGCCRLHRAFTDQSSFDPTIY